MWNWETWPCLALSHSSEKNRCWASLLWSRFAQWAGGRRREPGPGACTQDLVSPGGLFFLPRCKLNLQPSTWKYQPVQHSAIEMCCKFAVHTLWSLQLDLMDITWINIVFLSDPGIPGVRSMGPSVSHWLTIPFWNLTDVTLADEDTNSILTDNAKGNPRQCEATWSPPNDQIWNQCKWRHLMTKFWTNASGVTWLPNFQLMQVAPTSGQNCNWCLNLWSMQEAPYEICFEGLGALD